MVLRYLEKLLEYLSGYLDRVHPLLDQVGPHHHWSCGDVIVMSLCIGCSDRGTEERCRGEMAVRDFPWMEGEEEGVIVVMVTCSSHLQKDTGSAMAKHSGAHLDLSAFTSSEV